MPIIEKLPPLRDRIRPGVRVLFVGINPGVRSALTGHHFAGHSNRFWKLLYESGLVREPITCEQDDRLPDWGFGITNIVPRPTPGIDTLKPGEYVQGRVRLRTKIRRFRPEYVALVGVTVFRAMFPERKGAVTPGLQPESIAGSRVVVLPNPSGRNANFSYGEMLAAFRSLADLISATSGDVPAAASLSVGGRASAHRRRPRVPGSGKGRPAGRKSVRRGA